MVASSNSSRLQTPFRPQEMEAPVAYLHVLRRIILAAAVSARVSLPPAPLCT